MRHRKFHLYVQLSYTKISYLPKKNAFVERCCFLTFSFEGKLRKYDISVKRKHTKTNEIMIFSALFVWQKFFFSCSAIWKGGIFSRKHGIFSLDGRRGKDNLSQEIHGNRIFSIWYVPRLSAKKNQGRSYPAKICLKVVEIP